MWFPELEAPSPGLAAALARLGATIRLLPHAAARAGGFTMKAATILLSGFEEVSAVHCVRHDSKCSSAGCHALLPHIRRGQTSLQSLCQVLFLDADNIAVRDPSPLFVSPGYNATGALLWPDYWERSTAPDLADVLGLNPEQLPAGTFESGQMALDKRRCA